jgi:hypothetical protein
MVSCSVSALVSLATGTETGAFADVIERQIQALRKELDGSELEPSIFNSPPPAEKEAAFDPDY